ncbi:MAG TPA: alpha/beta fold hydrolase [Bdellovibrionota bacterium]|nr:alpha/beta fold hydrolase [Bdellovibrionota bacterium]
MRRLRSFIGAKTLRRPALAAALLLLVTGFQGSVASRGKTPLALERESPARTAEWEHRFETVIMPHYRTLGRVGSFQAQGFQPDEATPKRRIHYRVFERTRYSLAQAERGAIVIAPDRGELELQYAELIHDLTEEGYSVYILDHRGGGFSERLLRNPGIAHVDRFLDYSADFRQFIDEVVRPEMHRDLFLLCHSMGCAVAAPFMAANPRLFRAAAMTAPMFDLKLTGAERVASLISGLGLLPEGYQTRLAPGGAPYDEEAAFERNSRTGSWMRYRKSRELLADSEQMLSRALRTRVRIGQGGVSYRWLSEARAAMRDLELTEPWQTPTLIVQAGRDEHVSAEAQFQVCEKLSEAPGGYCRILKAEDSLHDVLMERDAIRSSALGEIGAFFASRLSQPRPAAATQLVKPLGS